MCPGVRPEKWLRWFAYLLCGVECSRLAQYPVFAPNTLYLLHAKFFTVIKSKQSFMSEYWTNRAG